MILPGSRIYTGVCYIIPPYERNFFVELFSWAVKNALTLHKYGVELFSQGICHYIVELLSKRGIIVGENEKWNYLASYSFPGIIYGGIK